MIEQFDCDECGTRKEYGNALTPQDVERGLSVKMRYQCPVCEVEEDE